MAKLAVAATALVAGGCAAGSGPAGPQVNLSIRAPTSGATVGVHQVTVTGTVSPANAQVIVNGQPAKVAGGVYRDTTYVASANQAINVSGAAQGYVPAHAVTTVTYSPGVAAQIVTAVTPKMTQSPATLGSQTASRLSPAQAGAIAAAFSLPSARTTSSNLHRVVGGRPGSGTTPPTPTRPAPLPPHGASGPSGGSGGSGGGNSGAGGHASPPGGGKSAPSGRPQPPPPPSPAQITAAIRQSWVHGCIKPHRGENVVPYCTCTYVHLEKRGVLTTRRGLHKLLKELRPYHRTGDVTKLPRFVRAAVNACVAKYPPPDPLSGNGKLSQLPGVDHPQQAGSNQPVAPAPSTP